MTGMTDERLREIEQHANWAMDQLLIPAYHGENPLSPELRSFVDIFREASRLRAELAATKAENERLRAVLTWFYELNADGVLEVPDEHYGVILDAATVLNPEPAP